MSGSNVESYVGTTEAHLSHTFFTWSLDKFSYRNTRTTSPIFTDVEKNEFHLELNPNSGGSLSLYILPTKLARFTLDVKYKFRLGASLGMHSPSFEGFGNLWKDPTSQINQRFIEIPKFVSREILFWNRDVFLQGEKDTLTIHCEISNISSDKKSLSPVQWLSQESACKEKTLADYGNLLKSGHLADVKLLVGGQTFSAHKLILSARSPIFAAMFAHDTLEKDQVEIPEVNPEAFKKFLSFLYTGALPTLDNIKSAEDLLIILDKYDCGQLKTVCEEYLVANLTIETAPNMLLFANSVNAKMLKEKTIEFMRGRGSELFDALQDDPDQLVNLFQVLAMKNQEKEKE